MESKQPLLSICIPTYNGGEKLRVTLIAIFKALKENLDIEVIVSDNCSTDNTQDVLACFSDKSQIRIYRNEKNLGFNRNLFLLIDKYANGKYCWVIGDDDFIDEGSLLYISNILQNECIEYLSVNYRLQTYVDYMNTCFEDVDNVVYKNVSFVEAINVNTKSSNVLGTFMSSSIFLRNRVRSFSKTFFSDNSWGNYYSTFPNSYLMCTLFLHEKCGCITTPVFTALIHEKSWDDKMDVIVYKYLPQLFCYYKTMGVDMKKMRTSHKIIKQSIFVRSIFLLRNGLFHRIFLYEFLKSFLSLSVYSLIFEKIDKKWRC